MKPLLIVFAVLLTGCSHKFTMSDMEGQQVGQGKASEWFNQVEVVINDKVYKGEYAFSEWSRVGKMFAKADDGDTVICDFMYRGFSMNGIGDCEDKNGQRYTVEIHY